MKHSTLLLVTILLTTPPISAQTVHKCPGPDGKPVYQETSCAGEAGIELKIETGKPTESRPATQEEIDLCLKFIKIRYSYKDPDSLRVEGSSVVAVYQGGRKEVMLSVNGKNSYGAYAGAKLAVCKYRADGDIESLVAF